MEPVLVAPVHSAAAAPEQYVNQERLFEDVQRLYQARDEMMRACDAADAAARFAGTPIRTESFRQQISFLCEFIRGIEATNRKVQADEFSAAGRGTKLAVRIPAVDTSAGHDDDSDEEVVDSVGLVFGASFVGQRKPKPGVAALKNITEPFGCLPEGSPPVVVDEAAIRNAILQANVKNFVALSLVLPVPYDLKQIVANTFKTMDASAVGEFVESLMEGEASTGLKTLAGEQAGLASGLSAGETESSYARFVKAMAIVSGKQLMLNNPAIAKRLVSHNSITRDPAVLAQVVGSIADRLDDMYAAKFRVPGQPISLRQELANSVDFRVPNVAALGAAAIYRFITEFNNWNRLPVSQRVGTPPFPNWMFGIDPNTLAEDFLWLMHKSGLAPLDTEEAPDASCSSLVDQAGCSVNFMQGLEEGAMKSFALNPSVIRLSAFWKPALAKANFALTAVSGLLSAMDQLEADRHRVDLADWQKFSRAVVTGVGVGGGGFVGGAFGAAVGAAACGSTLFLVPFVPICAAVGGVGLGLVGADKGRDLANDFKSVFLSETWTPTKFVPLRPRK